MTIETFYATIYCPVSRHTKDDEAREQLQAAVALCVQGQRLNAGKLYRVVQDCHGPWLKADGMPKNSDTDNWCYQLRNLLFRALGVGDNHVFENIERKLVSDSERIEVTVEAI